MWAEILIENREAVSSILAEHVRGIEEVLTRINGNDSEWLLRFLSDAKNNREMFAAPVVTKN